MSGCIGTSCKADSLLVRIEAQAAEIVALHAEIDNCHRRMIQMQPAAPQGETAAHWSGCHDAAMALPPSQPPREPLTSERVFEIWERAAQIDLSGRVNELIRTKDAQCVIRAIVMAAQEKP